MTLGFQLEYFAGYFANHYQAGDFRFESFGANGGVPWLSLKELENSPFEVNEVVHQSKSWHFLSFGSMVSFYELPLQDSNWVVLNPIMVHLLGFIWMQSYAFVLPGWLSQSRKGLGLILTLFGLSYALLPEIVLYICFYLEELTIEPLDSELMMWK